MQAIWSRCSLAGVVLIILWLCGCSRSVDFQKVTDQLVEEQYLKNFPSRDAIEFFESGGHYVDAEEFVLDQPHVLPLLVKLRQEFSVQPQCVYDDADPDRALAVIFKLPPGTDPDQVHKYLRDYQEGFPAEILVQKGYHWMGVDFLTPEQKKMLNL